jgi:hypothetical protein
MINWEGCGRNSHVLSKVLFQNLSGGTMESHEKPSL